MKTKLLPIERQRPSNVKRGDVVRLVMFDDGNNAVIESLKVSRLVRREVKDTKNGKLQLWDAVLKPVKKITIDGKSEIAIDSSSPVIAFTDRMAIYNAFAGFLYETPEERLLKAIFSECDGNEAKFRSLVKLAYGIVKKTEKEFKEESKESRKV